MLSKSRIVAIFALGLASTLIVVGILLPRLFPEEPPVPLSLQHTTLTLEDDDATVGPGYLAPGEDEEIHAPVIRQFNMELGEPATETEATARVGVSNARNDVDDDLESLLDAQIYSYRLDRVTGEAIGEATVADTPATPPTEVNLEGFWAKLPVDTQQESYDYYDWTLREALPAEFSGTETRQTSDGDDKEIFLFRQEIEPTKVGDNYSSVRTEMMTEDGKRADLFHSGWREIAVEPESGLIVGVEEHILDDYRRGSDDSVATLLAFEGRTTEENERTMLDQAVALGGVRSTQSWGTGLIWAGIAILIISLIVALRRDRKARERQKNQG